MIAWQSIIDAFDIGPVFPNPTRLVITDRAVNFLLDGDVATRVRRNI